MKIDIKNYQEVLDRIWELMHLVPDVINLSESDKRLAKELEELVEAVEEFEDKEFKINGNDKSSWHVTCI